jgi:hypothetical protein
MSALLLEMLLLLGLIQRRLQVSGVTAIKGTWLDRHHHRLKAAAAR